MMNLEDYENSKTIRILSDYFDHVIFEGINIHFEYDKYFCNNAVCVYVDNERLGFIERADRDFYLYNKYMQLVIGFSTDTYSCMALIEIKNPKFIFFRYLERLLLRRDIENTVFKEASNAS